MNPFVEGQLIQDNSTLALEPVKCIDCETYVPLGWVIMGTVKCPKNIGATGVEYGHRVPRTVSENLFDRFLNAVPTP